MAKRVTLSTTGLKELRTVDERLVSYNVEMTEVTGGTFWKAYTPEQVDGTEEFPVITDWHNMGNLQQWYDPIDTRNEKLIKLTKELGPAWVRVSGTWANKTYYDFDGHTGGQVPEGYQNLLTKDQWISLLDFVKAVDGKLLVSFANCPGNHSADEPWNSDQAKLLFDTSMQHGVPIDAVEFTNEPNMMTMSGLPQGYTADDHARDHDIFVKFVRENYPGTMIVGPCTCGDMPKEVLENWGGGKEGNTGGGIASALKMVTTDELIGDCTEKIDVFSYHYYNGVSERGAAMGGHWPFELILSENYLAMAGQCARYYTTLRDKYCPGGQIWVTESGDAGCGGNTWASTYADVPRTLNELGDYTTVTDGIIFHNTLASSDYGYLKHGTFDPRPNYFAVLLWNRLMGQTVYDCGPVSEGAHVYAHSRKDGEEGYTYLVINNSAEATTVELPKAAKAYVLTGDGKFRARVMLLNGKPLTLGENNELPELTPVDMEAGTTTLPAGACAFYVL
ncbi:MAG: beta-glucuronidase [Lachnospiraceae bacterium]|nr:beta-glucuronidase [Lachnospiraceae bacterium]